uniref:Uncharacterized protein n=1 Tax=Tanacetum cinerariifolium TaxID=118510 RepID=A0A6L2J3G1_TANCI|nr:hypothetical protein [Tanacetum cinerariifolium]
MLRKGLDFPEESIEKSWRKESANESGSKFLHVLIVPSLGSSIHVFSLVSDRGNIIRRTTSVLVSLYLNMSHILRNSLMCLCRSVLILPSNWFRLTRFKWLPLIVNSFVVSGMFIAEPGVKATTRSAAHIIFKDIKEVAEIVDVKNWSVNTFGCAGGSFLC